MSHITELSTREVHLITLGLRRQKRMMESWVRRGSMSPRDTDTADESTIKTWNSDIGIIDRLLREFDPQ